MTDAKRDPRLARLRELAAELAEEREAARERVRELERQRDEEILRVITRYDRMGAAAGRAARISRQRVDTIRRIDAAKRDQT